MIIYLTIHFIWLFIALFIYIHFLIYLFIYLFIYLLTYLFVYLFTNSLMLRSRSFASQVGDWGRIQRISGEIHSQQVIFQKQKSLYFFSVNFFWKLIFFLIFFLKLLIYRPRNLKYRILHIYIHIFTFVFICFSSIVIQIHQDSWWRCK